MSPQKVAWLFMQGFQTKYYLSEAECGDFVVNHQAMTLHTKKGMASTFATQFSSARPEVSMRNAGRNMGDDCVQRV